MAILCPGCGREYDAALFQFGRTIRCACGARVGLESRIELAPRGGERFLADSMLGGLARWLRILGYDTAWEPSIADEELARRAVAEGRRVLTRDRRFPEDWRIAGVVMVDSEKPVAQLREVARRVGLEPEPDRVFRRCPACNGLLEPAEPEDVRDRVPERVLREQDELWRCPDCGKAYWEGGHVRRIRDRLADLLG